MLLLIRKDEGLGMIIPRLESLYLTVESLHYNVNEPGTCPNGTLRFSKKKKKRKKERERGAFWILFHFHSLSRSRTDV